MVFLEWLYGRRRYEQRQGRTLGFYQRCPSHRIQRAGRERLIDASGGEHRQ